MTTIKLKNGSGAPTAGDLVQGEPALDLTNKRLYTEDSGGTVIEVGTNPTSVTTGAITATGIDVTGTVSADSYDIGSLGTLGSVATDRLFIATADGLGLQFDFDNSRIVPVGADGSTYNNNVSLGSSGLEFKNLLLSGNATVGGTVTADGLTVNASTTDMITFNHSTPSNLTTIGQDSSGDFRVRSDSVNKLKSYANGDFELYEDTGTTAKFYWDASAESLGIGTNSPNSIVDIRENATGGEARLRLFNTDQTNSTAQSALLFMSPDLRANGVEIEAVKENADFSAAAGRDIAIAFKPVLNNAATERMRIDSDGNVGIGTSSPSSTLDVESPDGTTSSIEIQGGDGNSKNLIFRKASAVQGRIRTVSDALEFGIGSSATEAMRIDSSGNLLVGTTTQSGRVTIDNDGSTTGLNVFQTSTATNYVPLNIHNDRVTGGNTAVMIRFQAGDNTDVGSIDSTVTATSYNTSSDQRLKENIVDAPSASDDIDAIQVRSFDWKVDGSHQKYGMVAQELQSVAPIAVSGDADSEDMMGVDYSKLVPMMLKEIQSLRARVAELENN